LVINAGTGDYGALGNMTTLDTSCTVEIKIGSGGTGLRVTKSDSIPVFECTDDGEVTINDSYTLPASQPGTPVANSGYVSALVGEGLGGSSWSSVLTTGVIATHSFKTEVAWNDATESIIGNDGTGWAGPLWDFIHNVEGEANILYANTNCAVMSPVKLEGGDRILVQGVVSGAGVVNGDDIVASTIKFNCGNTVGGTHYDVTDYTNSITSTTEINSDGTMCFCFEWNIATGANINTCDDFLIFGFRYVGAAGGLVGDRFTYSINFEKTA
jgi:hypothetical protein